MEDGNLSVTNINDSPYMLTGLMEYVNYTVVVYAHTDKGRGDGSRPIVVQTDEHCKQCTACTRLMHAYTSYVEVYITFFCSWQCSSWHM